MRALDRLALAVQVILCTSALSRSGDAVQQEPGLQRTDPLDLDFAAALAIEGDQRPPRLRGELDPLGLAARFETGGEVHRVAPDIVGEFAGADDAGHHRA